jgi:protein phosphatase
MDLTTYQLDEGRFLGAWGTATGQRAANQDNGLLVSRAGHCLGLVADGMGGQAHGEVASEATINHYWEAFQQEDALQTPYYFLELNGYDVNTKLLNLGHHNPEYKGTGTTVSGFLLNEAAVYCLNVGDSRTYRYHTDTATIERLTKDHSLVQQLVDHKAITPEQAYHHPEKHVLTSALGSVPSQLKVDAYVYDDQSPVGDVFLATTDGIHDTLRDEEIRRILAEMTSMEQGIEQLVYTAFKQGSTDNLTACMVWVRPDDAL